MCSTQIATADLFASKEQNLLVFSLALAELRPSHYILLYSFTEVSEMFPGTNLGALPMGHEQIY